MRVSEPQVRKDSRLFEELCAALLRRGNAVRFRVNGESMRPNLADGADVLVEPAKRGEVRRGDVVLAKNRDGLRVHRIDALDSKSCSVVLRSDTAHECDPPVSIDLRESRCTNDRRGNNGFYSIPNENCSSISQ